MVSGSTTLQFAYDCFNRRVSKTTNGVLRRYVWLGDDLAVEADSNWNVLASYFYQPGVDAPISRTDNAGSTVYYLADNAGSITALANSSGGIIGRYYYSPWGEIVSQDAGLPTQPLKWTGRELDETGLYYLRGRCYSPTLGRFLSEDPAGLGANLNLYLFALNNPVGSSDPFGLCHTNSGANDADEDNYSSMGDMLRKAGDRFRSDPQWNRGSPQRQEFSNGMNLVPPVALANALSQVVAGTDPIAGRDLSGGERVRVAAELAAGAALGAALDAPGPYAEESVFASRGPRRPRAFEQAAIDDIGNRFGCHSCGAPDPGTPSGHWIGDHQLPSKLNPPGSDQWYYPHCSNCSHRQGGGMRWR